MSEILEIRDGKLQMLLDLLPPWSILAVAILTVFDIGKVASVSVVMSALSFIQVECLVQFSLTFKCIRVAKSDFKHYLFGGSI